MRVVQRDFSKCPRCGSATRPSRTYSGAASSFWLECSQCNTYINTYIPQEHQEAVHEHRAKLKGNFGGYGTGKTTTSRQELYKHSLITPNGNSLVGAKTVPQYEQTIKRDIENDFPIAFIKDYSIQKAYITLQNGHRIMYRPLDDEGKLRSYELTLFIIVEASEVDQSIFEQLKTRLRSLSATVPKKDAEGEIVYNYTDRGVPVAQLDYDWREGIVESNPDPGWVRTEVLEFSQEVIKFGQVPDEYVATKTEEEEKNLNPDMVSFVASTDVNKFLPPNFVKEISRNKPLWWILRYVQSSFLYAEGLVYPEAAKCVVPAYPVDRSWKRVVAFDYGLQNPAAFIFGAINESAGKLVIYKEAVIQNKSIDELAEEYYTHTKDIPAGNLLFQKIDPKSGPRRDYNKNSLSDLFLEKGISFTPGAVSISARIYRLNTYITSGKLEIMDCCTHLIGELKGYKFPERVLGKPYSDKPVDKDNHAINGLEWICMELPADPGQLVYGVYNKVGEALPEIKQTPEYLYDPFQMEEYSFADPLGAFGIDFNKLYTGGVI